MSRVFHDRVAQNPMPFRAASIDIPHRIQGHVALHPTSFRKEFNVVPRTLHTCHSMWKPMSILVDSGSCCAVPKTHGRFGLNLRSFRIDSTFVPRRVQCHAASNPVLLCTESSIIPNRMLGEPKVMSRKVQEYFVKNLA